MTPSNAALLRIQLRGRELCAQLAPYDRPVLAREMALMPEWFCARHLKLTLDDRERTLIQAAFEFLIEEALLQPTVRLAAGSDRKGAAAAAERAKTRRLRAWSGVIRSASARAAFCEWIRTASMPSGTADKSA